MLLDSCVRLSPVHDEVGKVDSVIHRAIEAKELYTINLQSEVGRCFSGAQVLSAPLDHALMYTTFEQSGLLLDDVGNSS